jgi:hypothetical protein
MLSATIRANISGMGLKLRQERQLWKEVRTRFVAGLMHHDVFVRAKIRELIIYMYS